MLKTFASALGFIAMTADATPRLSSCPDYSPMATFDVNRYTGKWYEIRRDMYTPFEIAKGCVMAEYTDNGDSTLTVENSSHMFIKGWSSGKALAVVADTGDASLVVDFSGKTPSPSDKANYTVLDTDYDTYTVVYSCSDIAGFASFDFLWILAREPELDDATILSIVGKIEEKLPHYGFF